MVKKQPKSQKRPMAGNPYVQWKAGDEALQSALKGPTLPGRSINTPAGKDILKDILS